MNYDLHRDEHTNTVYVETDRLPKRWAEASINAVAADVAATFTGATWIPIVDSVDGGETLCFVPAVAEARNKGGRPRKDTRDRHIRCTDDEYARLRLYLAKLRAS